MKKFIFSKVVGIFSKFKGIFQGFYLDFKNAALSPQCIDLSSFHQTLKPPPPPHGAGTPSSHVLNTCEKPCHSMNPSYNYNCFTITFSLIKLNLLQQNGH